MSARPDFDLERLPDSANQGHPEAGLGWLRFAAPLEEEFAASHLRRARGRIRAWHSVVLVVLLAAVVPALLDAQSGGGLFGATWNSGNSGLLLALVVAIGLARATLALVAWSPWFERVYPRIALPLVAVCHAVWAFVCSGEILGAHPEYLAPLVADAFAAYFFSGLLFRQAIIVTALSAAALLFGGWHFTGTWAPIVSLGMHLYINMGMAAIAGFAYERSARELFVEHSLLREMAALDGLTGLKNRRSFDEHLERVWHQAVRDRRQVGILMIDVDHFKPYNDRYGHQAGDRALQRIADIVNEAGRRPLDLAARYGGEELAVILYDLPRERVVAAAERLHAEVAALAIEHGDADNGHVTVSIGAAIVRPRANRSAEGALQLADKALYEAKSEGRNSIRVLEHEYETLSTGAFEKLAG